MKTYRRLGFQPERTTPNPFGFQMPKELVPANKFVETAFDETLPDGVPRPFDITQASYSSRINHCTTARASVIMFDNVPAELLIMRYDSGMVSYSWTRRDGGDCSFENGRWRRVTEVA